MAATLIVQYLGQGLAAARPVTPAVDTGAMARYIATDTGAESIWYGGAWHAVVGGDPSVSAFVAVPALPGWDPQFIGAPALGALSNSNKTFTAASSSPYNHVFGTTARSTGKWYLEYVPGSGSFTAIGLTGPLGHIKDTGAGSIGTFGDAKTGQYGWQSGGALHTAPVNDGTAMTVATIQGWAAADTACIAVDLDAALIWCRTNAGNWNNAAIGSQNPALGVGGIDCSHMWSKAANKLTWPGVNSGSTSPMVLKQKTADFLQAVPAGFSSWSGL
jgi:hypothetical protein